MSRLVVDSSVVIKWFVLEVHSDDALRYLDKLLKRFVGERDEVAFAALVARHGGMVLGVCRRILHDEHDVEDAFQATFLVLVSRAKAIRDGGLLGHWIYGVAHRVAAGLGPTPLGATSTSRT